MNYTPQIPTFGFFLRSAVVKAFPSLEVHAPWPTSEQMDGNRMETVRLDCLEKDTLLCLFDRSSGQTYWNKDQGDGSRRKDITICQPPHQQCFRLGTSTTTDFVQMQYRTVYTKDPSDGLLVRRSILLLESSSGNRQNLFSRRIPTNSLLIL